MIGKETLKSRAAALGEVGDILEARRADGELGFEQQVTLDHAKKFTRLGKEKREELLKELLGFEKVKEEAAVKIVDLMPANADQLRLIFSKERYSLDEGEAEEVLDVVKKYLE
ncbi:MAG: RNA polymerase Rpb4 family protein [Candidatus Micrarchaeota archaeon]